MKQDLSKLVGQLFMIGFADFALPGEVQAFIKDHHLGGVVYFKRNVASPGQLVELANDIQHGSRPEGCPPLFIAIDHEGGRINRLVKPFTKFPGNSNLGELASPKLGFEFGRVLGKELSAVGINVNFAPVVDIGNRNSKVLKGRTFAYEPEMVSKLGSAVARGIQKEGVVAVAKHYPGHGCVTEDSHYTLPVSTVSLRDLREKDLIPFSRLVRSRVEGVMTAHIINKDIDPDYPATLSKKTIQILREEFRFRKVLFTDDLEMKAISQNYGVVEAAIKSIEAGCDVLIYKGEDESYREAFEGVVKAVTDGNLDLELIEQAVGRIAATKKSFARIGRPIEITEVSDTIGLPEHFRIADIITRKELPPGEF